MRQHPQDQVLVEFYSKDECHLCDVAKDILLNVRKHHDFRFVEIKIQPGTREYEEFSERIPVVFVNKKFAFQHRVQGREFVRLLEEAKQ